MSCPTSKIVGSQECNCDYIPPNIKKILFRKNRNGRTQIKINGKGKWHDWDGEYDEETKTITYNEYRN